MGKTYQVSIVGYERPGESVRKAVELCNGFEALQSDSRVFIKPNVVFWTTVTPFPKWGVITTSRVVEDMVVLLKDWGVSYITIGEGMVLINPKDKTTPDAAFEYLGYKTLEKRYGVKCFNIHDRPFLSVEIDDGISLKFSKDLMESDFLVSLPVLKTHAQTVVSLSIKNMKGALDMNSRKRCHSPDPVKDLNYMISRFPKVLPQGLALLDGIYTTERGPGFDGKVRRSNLLIASRDFLSADMVGAKVLGYDPMEVPHLAYAAEDVSRATDLSDIKVIGEQIQKVASKHQYTFPYTEDGNLPLPMKRLGIKGLSYPKYDLSLCTYCSVLASPLLTAIALAWKGQPWDDVEVLTGKIMKPTPGKKKTILIGKCIYQANKDNPQIQEMIPVKGCPPPVDGIIKAFHKAGIPIDPKLGEETEKWPGLFMKRYEGKEAFDESFFRIN